MQPASDPTRRKACAGSVRGGALAAVQALAVIGGDEQSDAIMRDEWCGLAPPSACGLVATYSRVLQALLMTARG
jgi:hypothetical protein